jgi:hypothetical protein
MGDVTPNVGEQSSLALSETERMHGDCKNKKMAKNPSLSGCGSLSYSLSTPDPFVGELEEVMFQGDVNISRETDISDISEDDVVQPQWTKILRDNVQRRVSKKGKTVCDDELSDLLGSMSFGDNFLLCEDIPIDLGKDVRQQDFVRKKISYKEKDKKHFRAQQRKKKYAEKKAKKKFDATQCFPHGMSSGEDKMASGVPPVMPQRHASTDSASENAPELPSRNDFMRAAMTAPSESSSVCSSNDDLSALLGSISVPNGIFSDDADATEWISLLENVVLFGYAIGRANSIMDVVVACASYMKMHTKKSLIKELAGLVDSLSTEFDASETIPHAWSAAAVKDKWNLFQAHPVFTKISYLMTAAMSLSVCSIKKIEWSPFGLKMISLEAAKKQLEAVDVIDALISTFCWVAETGYQVIQERSFIPLLYSDARMRKFNDKCDYVMAHSEQILAGNVGDVQDLEKQVDELIREVAELKAARDSGPTAIWLQQRYSQLVDVKFKIVGRHRNTALRFSPFGVGLTGPSGVGKSSLAKLVMKVCLKAMGFPDDPSRIITKDMFDRFDSTLTSDILGMYMDDIGQGKSAFAVTAVTDIIIKFFNNMAAQAVKAELNQKGVVFVNFKVGVMTSNLRDYDARSYSNKPEAILRRFVHTRVNVKESYRVAGGVSLNTRHPDVASSNDLCKDIWELDLEECFIYESKTGEETYQFRPMVVPMPNGNKGVKMFTCTKMDLHTYLSVLVVLARAHSAHQTNLLERCSAFDKMSMCSTCSLPSTMCRCELEIDASKIEPHSVDMITNVLVESSTTALRRYIESWTSPVRLINSILGWKPVSKMATVQLTNEFSEVLRSKATPIVIQYTPEWLFRSSIFQRSVEMWQHSAALYELKWPLKIGTGLCMLTLGTTAYKKQWKNCGLVGTLTWSFYIGCWAHYRARVRIIKSEYLARRDALPALTASMRDGHVVKGALAMTALMAGLKMLQWWNQKRLFDVGQVTPAGLNDPKQVDKGPGWYGYILDKMGVKTSVGVESKSATPGQVVETLQKNNVHWAEYTSPCGKIHGGCNIFFPKKSVAWLPKHIFYPKDDMTAEPVEQLEVQVMRYDGPGGFFKFKIDRASCVLSSHLDLLCCYVPNSPDYRDKTKWLPLKHVLSGKANGTLVGYHKKEKICDKFTVEFRKAGHTYMRDMNSGVYNTKHSIAGTCMCPIILEQKDPVIVGFHIGGGRNSDIGVLMQVTQSEARELFDELDKLSGIYLSSNATDIPRTQYEKEIVSGQVHPHSMAAKLETKDFVEVLGGTRLRTVQRSTVEPSILSKHVEEVMGVPNKWGPPKLIPNWAAYNETLKHIADPADMFWPKDVERARKDWLRPLIPAMVEYSKSEDFRPLTEKESILGVPGKRFLEPLNMATGAGFPVFGPKKRLFHEIRVGEELVDRIPNDDLRKEIDRLEKCWNEGNRAYPVTTATLKDEPTKLSSEKVRVFQAAPVAFSIMIRKYFLPLARFLSLHPLISESAVGVNCVSPEWQELMAHVTKFAPDKQVIAWDYSKYDVRMNSQITRAVMACYLDLAKIGGYPKDAIHIMEMMIADITHPLIDYNGVLLLAMSMNTSGNNMTVITNSTGGSIYVRLGFFHCYPNAEDFRSCVAALTYGDDFKGSVKEEFRNFNFFSYRSFLAQYGIKITPPDKESEGTAFMDDDDADFLKRNSHYIPEIGYSLGRLDEDSIFKSLHANLKSKVATKEEIAISTVECAMHEWFIFGKEHYEMRAQQMKEVCRRANVPVSAVHRTFDERVLDWKEKYCS